jgi:hypothetical protein
VIPGVTRPSLLEVFKTVSSALVVAPGTKDAGPEQSPGSINPYRARMGWALEEVVENQVFVGIDVCKARLDAALRPGDKTLT